MLQGVVLIYTLASVAAKMASGCGFLSVGFFASYGIEILLLGLYAVLWQQAIGHFKLSVAYANKAFGIVWSLLWAALIFQEAVTAQNLVGAAIVLAGIGVVNADEH